MHNLDQIDRKLLAALQTDGRLTNSELAAKIGLSASQCSRRRTRLEEVGCINGYHAHIDRSAAGVALTSIISLTLATHNADNAKRFAALVAELPSVLEAYSLTGEMDYQLKVVTADLKSLSDFINTVLLPHESVQNVKTAIVLETVKETSAIPLQSQGSAVQSVT